MDATAHVPMDIDVVGVARGEADKRSLKTKAADRVHLGRACRRSSPYKRIKRASACELKAKLDEESVSLKDGKFHFDLIDENGVKTSHEIPVDMSELSTPKYTKEHMETLGEINKGSGRSATETFSKGIGGYGAVVNILSAAQYFSKEEYGKGALSLTQAAHAIGGLTGLNDVIAKVTKRVFKKVMTYTVEKIGLEKTLEKISQAGAEALGETATKVLGRFGDALPFVGIAFDLYFVAEDIKALTDKSDKTVEGLKIAHLVLDVASTVLNLVETAAPETAPFVEPIIIVLTIIRVSLDDFYNDISSDLAAVKGKPFGDKVKAFFLGVAEGITDVFTLGLDTQLKQLYKQNAYDIQLMRNMTDPTKYFAVTFKGKDKNGNTVGTIDMTAGVSSQYGGFMTVELNDDDSFTITLPDVPTKDGTTTLTKTISFSKPVTDIVLGVGQVSSPVYMKKTAKLWMLIPVKSIDVIDSFLQEKSSRYGVYRGNSDANHFYAVQAPTGNGSNYQGGCVEPDPLNKTVIFLKSYSYDLYGGKGDDQFFLGPQGSSVWGDEGSDMYYLQPDGGKAMVNNFALDEEQDTIFLNISYGSIQCYRDGWDLIVTYCRTHFIEVENWFVHGNAEYHRHVYLVTQDGVGIEVANTKVHNKTVDATCLPVSIDKSRSGNGETIALSGDFIHVKQVTGSPHKDQISGNSLPNTIRGGLGDDNIQGGNGPDVYLIKEGDGSDVINNFAQDQKQDTLVFSIDYRYIHVVKDGYDLILSDSMNNRTTTTIVRLTSWYRGESYQHMNFISKDNVRFTVGSNADGTPKLLSLTLDFGSYAEGIKLDLMHFEGDYNYQPNEEMKTDAKNIFDTPHNDILKANILGNFMTCSGGVDYLEGRGGRDVYIIDQKCTSVTIRNFDSKKANDLILFKCAYDNIRVSRQNDYLMLKCTNGPTVYMEDWFVANYFQHCQIKTLDKVTAFLPSDNELQQESQKLIPVEMESSEDCGGKIKTIDLSLPINRKVERFTAKTDSCSFNIIGNNISNYLDPGPDSPYGYQKMKGGNGTDTYVIGHNYGAFNEIDNSASDGEIDHLMFKVVFHDIEAFKNGDDLKLTSKSHNDSVGVTLKAYYTAIENQHILVHSADDFIFVPTDVYPYVALKMMDYTKSQYSQVIEVNDSTTVIVTGALNAQNHITAGKATTKITGGNENDVIIGSSLDNTLMGLDGDDLIIGGDGRDYIFGGDGDDVLKGGDGDDVIYGGMGADKIDGGDGYDSVVFSGDDRKGVMVDLAFESGMYSDAEGDSYISIENVLATEYNDTLFGSNDDNFLKGYSGSDYIVPRGGIDVLYGGPGSDYYDLTDAFGKKTIMNFASDLLEDLIILNKTSSKSICYFYRNEDLEITINFDNRNYTVKRILADENYLKITIGYVLRNVTYQHISILFSDGYIYIQYPQLLDSTGKEFTEMYSQIMSGNIVTVSSNAQNTQLIFNFTRLELDLPDIRSYQLQYVRLTQNITHYAPIVWLDDGGMTTVTESNHYFGVENTFFVSLTACGQIVALSPPVSYMTPPSPPTHLVASAIQFDGFILSWTSPDSNTDPQVDSYNYIITVERVDGAAESPVKFIANSTSYTTYSLSPESDYRVTVASQFKSIKSIQSSPVQVRTGKNHCNNFQNLSTGLKIVKFITTRSSLIATFACVYTHRLVGDASIACNDNSHPLPTCTPITCTIPRLFAAVIIA